MNTAIKKQRRTYSVIQKENTKLRIYNEGLKVLAESFQNGMNDGTRELRNCYKQIDGLKRTIKKLKGRR